MKTESLHIGMKVRHPAYGFGVVRTISRAKVDIEFEDGGMRAVSPEESALQPAEPVAEITGLDMPLHELIRRTVEATTAALGLEMPDAVVDELGGRWDGGIMELRPANASLQSKEIPIESFFHKIVMMRNNLRVLEQKINASGSLSEGEKVELQQYITRCYGSMTTFNILFAEKEGQFRTK